MRNPRPKAILDRDALEDLWSNTLSRIPSVFGRLVYLSSLRDVNTGRYEHHGLAQVFSADEAHRALRLSHLRTFTEWAEYQLDAQKADLDLYLAEFCQQKKLVIETWLRLASYRNFIPASVRGPEVKLYLSDIESLLGLLKNVYGVSIPDPSA